MTLEPNQPLDRTHAECIATVGIIRRHVATLRSHVARWEPTPMPKGWT